MAALFTLLSSNKGRRGDVKPGWVNAAVSSLLSKQISRSGGLLGILNVMLGRTEEGQPQSLPSCRDLHVNLDF